jgi:hypothetical protein
MAGHSRVHSSTMVNIRITFPVLTQSLTKSIDQRSFALVAVGLVTAPFQRIAVAVQTSLPNLPRGIVAERMIKAINPNAEVWSIQDEWQSDFQATRACDIVFGCIDGFSGRAQLEESCRRAIIPLIDIGMDVHKDDPYSISGQVIVSMPGRPCFRCMGFIRQKDLDAEGRRYGEGGGNPQVF